MAGLSAAYPLLKTAHVASAAILFGTGLGIAFFCWFGYRLALRTRDLGTLRSVLRLTVIADAVFTAPAVVFQTASGLALMHLLGWPWLSPWSVWVYALFLLTGACWLPVVVLQIRLAAAARRADSIDALPPGFATVFRWWFALGIPAFAAVLGLYWLMVAKPLPVV